ncbi:50S ribosomal protein L24 [Candidatus Pacearchaeota archaeon]|nr:50S ribosomal protein L24 [Candidatus Pacearchaeota archaeon]
MKSQFSPSWISSIQKRKQRKFRYAAPLHVKHKFLSAHLPKDLRAKYGKRSLPLRVGDEVLVMRGSFKKKRAKITSVNLKKGTVFLEGIQRSKRDGSKVSIPFNPRALLIQSLHQDDKERLAALQRTAPAKKISSPKQKS